MADLQDSVRICAELPPEEYFELINQMRKNVEESFRNYYGIYGKHAGDGLVYYFLKDRDSHYIVNSLYCAMEIKNKMEKLSAEWKVRKRWDNELYLNIGINEGQEYFSAIHASTNIEFNALGDTINYASRLSDLSRYGSILITKNLINKMDNEDRQRFIFGIKRKTPGRGIFIENMFSRVIDFIHVDDPRYGKFMDIAMLPVTEIVGRVSHSL
jgi:class 3 adenylate cyclase